MTNIKLSDEALKAAVKLDKGLDRPNQKRPFKHFLKGLGNSVVEFIASMLYQGPK